MLIRPHGVDRGERGQALIVFVAIFTLIFVLAAFVIDGGLAFENRQVAQKDADAAARAGAAQYIAALSSGASVNYDTASEASITDATRNGNDAPADPVTFSPPTCKNMMDTETTCARQDCPTIGATIPGVPSVEVAARRPSEALFSRIFNVASDNTFKDVGARSVACAGSVTGIGPGTGQLIPNSLRYGLNDCFISPTSPTLKFGHECQFETKSDSLIDVPGAGACEGGPTQPPLIGDAIATGVTTPFLCSVNTCTPNAALSCSTGGSGCSGPNQPDCASGRNGASGQNDAIVGFQRRLAPSPCSSDTTACSAADTCAGGMSLNNGLAVFRAALVRVDGQPTGGPSGSAVPIRMAPCMCNATASRRAL